MVPAGNNVALIHVMEWGRAAIHWLHLTGAILWVGGALFTSLVVHPVLRRRLEEGHRMAVYAELGRRLTIVQWATWSLLLATGLYKLWELRTTPDVFLGPFGAVLAVKLSFVSGMVVLSLIHARSWGPAMAGGRLPPAERAALARRAAFWGKVNGGLMLAIVFCAALLRFNPF